MKDKLQSGMFIEKKIMTTPEMAASRFHESSPDVLSSPSLLTFLQTTCADLLAPFLDPREMAVTVRLEVSHLASTPIGMTVNIRVEVIRVDGNSVSFRVTAHDEIEKTADGYNDMFIIDQERFIKGLDRKTRQFEEIKARAPQPVQ